MPADDDILSLLEEKGAEVARAAQRAVILQPGALGDCVLTLPLVGVMKQALNLGGVDIIGHTETIGILPGRSGVSSVRSIESSQWHRLFAEANTFDLEDRDPLVSALSDYAWIVTFMGEPNSNFEKNLIFTANCSHSAEVITLALKPPALAPGRERHIAEFYVQQFAEQCPLAADLAKVEAERVLVTVTASDRERGLEVLDQIEVDASKKLVVMHPGSGGRHKCWHLENFVSLGRTLRGAEIEVVFLLGPAEGERFGAAEIAAIEAHARLAADLPLTDVVGLLACADAFIGNDSGITHLAAAMGLRTFALFGPTDPALYRPIGPALTVFRDPQDRFTRQPSPDLQRAVGENLIRWLQDKDRI